MAIHLTGLSTQNSVGKNERTSKEGASGTSVESNVRSNEKMAEDTVRLSGAAQTLQSQEAKISSLPDVDMEKVEQIKRAIAAGEYRIDSQKLANNMASMDSLF
ncbi:flagellar biosynthesis anti-sigma factor FlgM [Marinomonas dokdonensis]|uniref:flagellar biosynthesis anti-sigma factor FlgM n=1 Tax=Marinomonas dokdonensis TaxID=328224 RepID=UPI0040557CC0